MVIVKYKNTRKIIWLLNAYQSQLSQMNPRDAVLYAVLYTKVMITHCDNLVTVVQSFGAVSEV